MATQLVCDGCRTPLCTREELNPSSRNNELIIRGKRVGGIMVEGSLLPLDDEFHWCITCARMAFRAVQHEALKARGWVL